MLLSSSQKYYYLLLNNKRDTIACVSFRYYKSLLILSPCLRGTKIANPREQSQARLSYAEQEQFGQSQPKAEGVNKYPQANYTIENRHYTTKKSYRRNQTPIAK